MTVISLREQSFYEAGKALAELRNRRLYRSTHKKFEDYCRDRFQFNRDKADLMIKSVEIMENLKNDDNCRRLLPTAESQIRDPVNLTSIEQCQVYEAAIEECGATFLPRGVIKDTIKRLKEFHVTLVKTLYSEGDLVKIRANVNMTLRKYDSYWGFIIKKSTDSCIVRINGSIHGITHMLTPTRSVRSPIFFTSFLARAVVSSGQSLSPVAVSSG